MHSAEIMSSENIVVIDDDLWAELIAITNGAVTECYQCGVCSAVCPWGLFGGEALSIRYLLMEAQIGLAIPNKQLWLCTTCDQCSVYCPRGVDIPQVIRAIRSITWKNNRALEGLSGVLWSQYWNNNPWSQPPSQKANWATELNIPLFDPGRHDLLLYIGCTSSYDRRAQKIASSLVTILQKSGARFGYLGELEPCCGESILSLGHLDYFHEVVQEACQVFKDRGVTNIVTISPHCFDVFNNFYPKTEYGIIPLHYTQYLSTLLSEESLSLSGSLERIITFQDPCYLGRHNGIYDSPRAILNAIEGVQFVEMADNKQDGLCCGGGGGRMWVETEVSDRFSNQRIDQALNTGAETLVTACPFCVVCLEDSVKSRRECDLEVQDIAEIVAKVL